MHELDFDASSLRDWMAGVGLLRIVSETSDGRMQWRIERGRYRLVVLDAPDDLVERCANWVADNRASWQFADKSNAIFAPEEWRQYATAAQGLEAALWCVLGSDAVMHNDGKKIQASTLEYAHGGGHQHWLRSMRDGLTINTTAEDFARLLIGRRHSVVGQTVCRWDPDCDRPHAYRAKAPSSEKMGQDQTVNALAAIGLASCPSAPTRNGLATPIVVDRSVLHWPVWTDAIRIANLEAALCCDHRWPLMTGRRWIPEKLYCFSRGRLREPEVSFEKRGGSREQIVA